jgi:hypothetical protein
MIHVSHIHEAVKLSIPYDLSFIVSGFYHEFSRIPVDGQIIWSDKLTKQQRFMTVEQIFTLLHALTKDIPDCEMLARRLVGHLAGLSKVPYTDLETVATRIFSTK